MKKDDSRNMALWSSNWPTSVEVACRATDESPVRIAIHASSPAAVLCSRRAIPSTQNPATRKPTLDHALAGCVIQPHVDSSQNWRFAGAKPSHGQRTTPRIRHLLLTSRQSQACRIDAPQFPSAVSVSGSGLLLTSGPTAFRLPGERSIRESAAAASPVAWRYESKPRSYAARATPAPERTARLSSSL